MSSRWSSACVRSPQDAGLSLPQLALAWVLREPNVASAIVGVSRPEQLDDNAAAAGVALDRETLAAIDEVLAGVVVNPVKRTEQGLTDRFYGMAIASMCLEQPSS